jgi:hypothetical protein
MPNDDIPLVDVEAFLDSNRELKLTGHNNLGQTAFFTCAHRDLGDGLFEVCFIARWVMRGRDVDGKLICEPPPGWPPEPEEP